MIQEYVNIIKQIDEDSQRKGLLKTVDRAAEGNHDVFNATA